MDFRLLRWRRACDELKLRFAMECRSCSTWRNAFEAIEGFDSPVCAVGRGPSSFAFPVAGMHQNGFSATVQRVCATWMHNARTDRHVPRGRESILVRYARSVSDGRTRRSHSNIVRFRNTARRETRAARTLRAMHRCDVLQVHRREFPDSAEVSVVRRFAHSAQMQIIRHAGVELASKEWGSVTTRDLLVERKKSERALSRGKLGSSLGKLGSSLDL